MKQRIRSRSRPVAVAGVLVGALLAFSPASAFAGDITVIGDGSVDDVTNNGNCTLREAIQAANTNAMVDMCVDPGGPGSNDRILLGNDTYVITIPPDGVTDDDNLEGDFDTDTDAAAGNLTIHGNGRLVTEIDAEDIDRVLHLHGPNGTLTVEFLSVRNGDTTGADTFDRGGGIFASGGALTLDSVDVVGSHADDVGGGIASMFAGSMTFFDSRIGPNNTAAGGTGGAGIHWDPGNSGLTLTLQGTEVRDNQATAMAGDSGGGGIASFGTMVLNSAVVTGNTATAPMAVRGGGISHNGFRGPMTIRDSVISNNSSTSTNMAGIPQGGGIYFFNQLNPGDLALSIERSTVSANFVDSSGASQFGGGIYGGSLSRMRLVNSTVSGNMAPDGSGDGGGIHDNGVQIDVAHTTFSGNDAADQGDAVNLDAAQADTLRNSIIAEGANACDTAFFTTAGGNVDAGSTCWSADMATDIQNAPPQLGMLAQNGGALAFTHALGLGSPARDRVPIADCVDDMAAVVNSDARGVARPFPAGGLCDSGSYELIVCNGAPFTPSGPFTGCPPPPTTTTPGTTAPSAPAAKKKCKKKKRKKKQRTAAAAKKKRKKKKC